MSTMTKPETNKIIRMWSIIIIGGVLTVLMGVMLFAPSVNNANATEITVYKSPNCGCCSKWVDHLRGAGFKVTTNDRMEMNSIKLSSGVKSELRSCHTALVGGYVIEGHVPANDIKRLLQEHPDVTGLAVPGMPMGSPGMEGHYKDNYDVLTFKRNGETSVFTRY